MVEAKDFLRTINENPRRADPLSVFADWLEENGECDLAEKYRDLFKLVAEAERIGGECEYLAGGYLTCLVAHQRLKDDERAINETRLFHGFEGTYKSQPGTLVVCRWCKLQKVIRKARARVMRCAAARS